MYSDNYHGPFRRLFLLGPTSQSWRLMTLNEQGDIAASVCCRFHEHPVRFSELRVNHLEGSQTEAGKLRLKQAVEREISRACHQNVPFMEVGEWIFSKEVRPSTEILRMMAVLYRLARRAGGASGITIAPTLHSPLLLRLGSHSVFSGNLSQTVLTFGSSPLKPQFSTWMKQLEEEAHKVPVLSSGERALDWSGVASRHPSQFLRMDHLDHGWSEGKFN